MQFKAWGKRYTQQSKPFITELPGHWDWLLNCLCPSRVAVQVVLQLLLWCLKTLLPERMGFRNHCSLTSTLPMPAFAEGAHVSEAGEFVTQTYTRLPCRKEIHRELVQRRGQSEDYRHAWERLGSLVAKEVCSHVSKQLPWKQKYCIIYIKIHIFKCSIWIIHIHTQVCGYIYIYIRIHTHRLSKTKWSAISVC